MPEDIPGADYLLTWILGGVGVIVAALATVITTLWKSVENKNLRTLTVMESHVAELLGRVRECEEDRAILHQLMQDQSSKIALLEHKVDSFEKKS